MLFKRRGEFMGHWFRLESDGVHGDVYVRVRTKEVVAFGEGNGGRLGRLFDGIGGVGVVGKYPEAVSNASSLQHPSNRHG